MKKITTLILLLGLLICGTTEIFAEKGQPNRIKFIVKNAHYSFPLDVRICGRIAGKNANWEWAVKEWNVTGVINPDQVKEFSIYDKNFRYYVWTNWHIDGESYAYIMVKPKGSSDDKWCSVKIIRCCSEDYDYKVEERHDGYYKIALWSPGKGRTYDGRWIPGNYGDDTSDICWRHFGFVEGNDGNIRDGVIAVHLSTYETVPHTEYNKYKWADWYKITLPKWCENYFSGKTSN